jgi:LEA14-like dessication related protein
MKNLKVILFLGGLGAIGYALVRYYKSQIQYLSNIEYSVVGIKIVQVTSTNISVDITNRLFNSSNVEATITEMYLDFKMNGVLIGNITDSKENTILPQQSSDLTYRFNFNPQLVLGNIVNLVTLAVKAKDITFDAVGYVKIKSSFLATTIPFEYHNNLKSLLK